MPTIFLLVLILHVMQLFRREVTTGGTVRPLQLPEGHIEESFLPSTQHIQELEVARIDLGTIVHFSQAS